MKQQGGLVMDWSHIPVDILKAWPNCATPDCEFKCCTWATNQKLCAPCNETLYGKRALIQAYNETHDTPWEDRKNGTQRKAVKTNRRNGRRGREKTSRY